jgi:hypothetical protein
MVETLSNMNYCRTDDKKYTHLNNLCSSPMYGTKILPKFFFHLKLSPHSTQVNGRSEECTKQKFNSGINVCTDGMLVFSEGFTNLS